MKACLFALLIAISATDARAELISWKTVGWWEILASPDRNGCFALVSYEDGLMFGIGLFAEHETSMEVHIGHASWKSIQEGKEYNVQVKFGNRPAWNLRMYGKPIDGVGTLFLTDDAYSEKSGKFYDDFAKALNMRWTFEGKSLGHLQLNGSTKAFSEVIKCTKSLRNANQSVNDPFSASTLGATDPFR